MKMSFAVWAIIPAYLGCIVATSSFATDLKKAHNITLGEPKEQVEAAMGKPGDRQFRDNREAWQYCSIATPSSNKYVVVWFEDGKVRGIGDYTKFRWGFCASEFNEVHWADFPQHVDTSQSVTSALGDKP